MYNDDVVLYDMTACPIIVTIVVESADETMGTTTGGGIAYYDFDNEISAVANEGYHFVQWSDGETEATRKVNSFEDVELQAIFAPDGD